MSKQKHIFTTSGLTATKWDTVEDKAKFLNDLANLVRSEFNPKKFTKKLYQRLSMTFGHIAHYNDSGFYGNWFETAEKQLKWVNHTLRYGCYGSPEYTYCDAELLFQQWLQSEEGLELIEKMKAREREATLAQARRMLEYAQRVLADA